MTSIESVFILEPQILKEAFAVAVAVELAGEELEESFFEVFGVYSFAQRNMDKRHENFV